VFVTKTFAPGTTAVEESVTVPVRVPRSPCAVKMAGSIPKRANIDRNLANFTIKPLKKSLKLSC
jgi:hypothetical protein